MNIDREIERILARLRQLMRERGFTQQAVQTELGWGRSYISQLMTRQKCLRCEQVLRILGVVDVEPKEFWDSLYAPKGSGSRSSPAPGPWAGLGDVETEEDRSRRALTSEPWQEAQ